MITIYTYIGEEHKLFFPFQNFNYGLIIDSHSKNPLPLPLRPHPTPPFHKKKKKTNKQTRGVSDYGLTIYIKKVS
jgi:hypothetical protein